MLESREEKRLRKEKLAKENEVKRLQEREERVRREQEEKERQKEKQNQEFISKLDEKIKTQKVITCTLSNVVYSKRGEELKDILLNHMLQNNYICVQNDAKCTEATLYHVLTFVREEYLNFFATCK